MIAFPVLFCSGDSGIFAILIYPNKGRSTAFGGFGIDYNSVPKNKIVPTRRLRARKLQT